MTTLAFDIGGTKIRAGLVEAERVWDVREIPTFIDEGETSILPSIIRLAQRYEGMERIAVAAAGVVRDGVITSATDLIPAWAGTDLEGEIRRAFGLPVGVLGDVHAHGVGEAAHGAARDHATSLTVGVGTGIGGAFIRHRKPATGANGVAGHVGHITHGAAKGLLCSCGRTGHIEPLASGTGLCQQYERATGELISGRELDARASGGDTIAIGTLETGGFALGEVLGSLANALDPGIIIVSGSVARSKEFWWPAVKEGFTSSAMDPVSGTDLVPGQLGDAAPLIGAAVFAKDAHV